MPKQLSEDERAAAELLGDIAPKSLAEALDAEPDPTLVHAILSPAEVQAARDKARAAILAKQKKTATEALIAEETRRLEREEGLVTGDGVKDEMVTLHLDLAEHSGSIKINGTPYYHGQTYTVPRHVADTLREIMARGHGHQNEIEGKGMAERFRRPHGTVIDVAKGRVDNAPKYQGGVAA